MNCISECDFNVLNGNIALTGCEKRKLSKHKQALRKLVDREVPYRARNALSIRVEFSCFLSWQQFCPRLLLSLQPSNTIHVT